MANWRDWRGRGAALAAVTAAVSLALASASAPALADMVLEPSGTPCPPGFADADPPVIVGGDSHECFGSQPIPRPTNIVLAKTLQAAALAPGNFGNYALDLWIEEAFDETNAGILGFPQGQSVHLGMYTTSGATGDLAATGGRFVTGGATIRGGGFGVTDTAGALPSGTTMPQFRDSIGSGGLTGGYDATGLFGLSGNQQLVFNGVFDYRHDSASVGAGAGAADGGSFQTDSYMFRGAVLYGNNTTYFRGAAATSFGSGKETASADGSSGSFNTRGYFVDGRLGNVFVLLNTTGMPYSPTPSPKAPKPTGGVVVGLDLSGHLGYADSWIDGFTDTSGFTFGTMETRYGDIGGRAKLFASTTRNGLLWMPYVAGTVDRQFGFSSTLAIPAQAAIAGGDLVSFQPAQTFWGAQWGLDVRGPAGWTMGIKGFYSASADTNILGGSASIKIPFNSMPMAASRY